ncbi:hypothetical protein V8C34DRAFT_45768 [Trichoderma compactum]
MMPPHRRTRGEPSAGSSLTRPCLPVLEAFFLLFPFARLLQRYWLSDTKLTANQTSPRFVKNDRQAFSGKPYVSQDGDLHQFSWSIAMSLPRAGGKQTISTSTCSYMLVLCSDGVLVKRGPSKSSSRGRRHSSLYTRPEQHRVPPSPAWPLGSFPLCLIITQGKKKDTHIWTCKLLPGYNATATAKHRLHSVCHHHADSAHKGQILAQMLNGRQ